MLRTKPNSFAVFIARVFYRITNSGGNLYSLAIQLLQYFASFPEDLAFLEWIGLSFARVLSVIEQIAVPKPKRDSSNLCLKMNLMSSSLLGNLLYF